MTYHNPDNGYCVLRVQVRGHRDLVTVLGHAASISAGEFVQASGKWEVHREHGQQFRAAFLKSAPPSSLEGMEKYLGSGLIKGIGPVYAKKLVKAFGEAVFDVIEQQGERLIEVAGIGPKRASKIRLAWSDQKAIREIMVFLQSHGVGTSRAVRIYKTYGADAIPLVTENPYRLARDIRGIGFKTADMIAEKLGIPKTAMIRARAGISYALLNAVDDGHCGLPRDELLKLAEDLLEIPTEILEDAINLELGDGHGGRRHHRGTAVRLHEEAVGGRADHRRAAPVTAGRPAALADHRGRQGHRVGAGEARRHAGGKPAGGGPDGPGVQGRGHHRRTGGG